MKITFLGAAKEVTGSKHLIEHNGTKVLLDCGMFQGYADDIFEKNSLEGFITDDLDAVILSHAHIDHSGLIPRLFHMGYKREIYSTPATKDLCELMLKDSAFIQEKETEYWNKKKAHKPRDPLYSYEDAERVMLQFHEVNYSERIQITDDVSFEFLVAGHILGAAFVKVYFNDEGAEKVLFFTGDMGRKNLPILKDPQQVESADYVISESTYGNRLHDDVLTIENELAEIVLKAVRLRGKIIIPAFSVERTQEIVYTLHKLHNEERIPMLPIYIDSPLAVNVTNVFMKHTEEYDSETLLEFTKNDENPFGFGGLNYILDQEESRELNSQSGPMIIISASGMCDHGRIKHHLRNAIEDERNIILIVGYMAEGSLGRKLVDKENIVKIFDKRYFVKAQVKTINAFSGHADQKELLSYLGGIKDVKKIFLVHGEEDAQKVFKEKIEIEKIADEVYIPSRGEEISL